MSALLGLTAHELAVLLQKKEVSSEELVQEHLARIEKVEEQVKAFVTITEKEALTQAKKVDEKRRKGEELSPLAGIPMALKDNLCTEGIRTTAASRMLANFTPPYSATVAEKLQAAGAVLLGKCNLDEFAMGSSTETSAFFPTRNPFDLETVPGGSSGGSAAAVAASEVVFSLGTDTGGSIRQPAAFCGVIGLKPTYGSVSRYGVIPCASSLEQVGCLTRDIQDCALVMNTIYGDDPKDSLSASAAAPDFTTFLDTEIKGLKIGLPTEYLQEEIEPHIKAYFQQAVAKLREMGALCEEVSLPHTKYALPVYHIIATAEAASNMARYDGVQYGLRSEAEDVSAMFTASRSQGFGEEVKQRILLGTHVVSSGQYEDYYVKALKARTLIKQDFEKIFEQYDCLLTPTTLTTAFPFGAKSNDSLAMYRSDLLLNPVNLAGLPALSLPFGQVEGHPVGIQLIGRAFAEGTLLRVAYAIEQQTKLTRLLPTEKGVI